MPSEKKSLSQKKKKVAMNTVINSCRSSGTKKKDFHVASRDSSASTTSATPTDSTAHHEKENRVGHEGLGRYKENFQIII